VVTGRFALQSGRHLHLREGDRMARPSFETRRQLTVSALAALLVAPTLAHAVAEKEVTRRPDGTVVEKEKTTTYYPPGTDAGRQTVITGAIGGAVAIFGGVIALLGVRTLMRSTSTAPKGGTAEVSLSKQGLHMRRITQGAVLTFIGSVVMLGALYFVSK
jgi:hypothetical protein